MPGKRSKRNFLGFIVELGRGCECELGSMGAKSGGMV
jgi:hypothetical protein